MTDAVASKVRTIALAGNPNSGKTSLFNHLTGARRQIGNYPGVTVERVTGRATLPDGGVAQVVDLPGAYSLTARSADERIARDVLLGLDPTLPRPDVVVAVVDASSLERSLFFATQLMEAGIPMVVALTMNDLAARRNAPVNSASLEARLGVPVVALDARRGKGIRGLVDRLDEARARRPVPSPCPLRCAWRSYPSPKRCGVRRACPKRPARGEALRLLLQARADDPFLQRAAAEVREAVSKGHADLAASGADRDALEAELRYEFARTLGQEARPHAPSEDPSERIDGVLTHPIAGPIIFFAVMAVVFQAIFTWAGPFQDMIEVGTGWLQETVGGLLPEGMFHDLMVDGVLAGVGNVIIFVPQIAMLFLFLTVLEHIGYLARAAFLVDRVMRGVGLSGKSFVPLMSSFACANPRHHGGAHD